MNPLPQLVLLLFIVNIGESQNYLIWDNNFSNKAFGENLLSMNRLVHDAEAKIFKAKLFPEDNFMRKTGGIGYRFAKSILFDLPIDYFTGLAQHEVFGHGFYYRAYGFEENKFYMTPPPPYGAGGGSARRGTNKKNRQLSTHESLSIDYGGVEAGAVMATSIQEKWLASGKVNTQQCLLFFTAYYQMAGYILNTDYNKEEPSHDIKNYLAGINTYYGYPQLADYRLDIEYLKRRMIVKLANPMNILALYAYFKKYGFDGEPEMEFPFIKLLGWKYFPSIDWNLNPFGSEMVLTQYLKNERMLFSGEFRLGDNKLNKFWGAGIGFSQIQFNRSWYLEGKLDFWNQPSLELGGDRITMTKKGFGAGLKVAAHYRIFKENTPVFAFTELGYKTNGYLFGELLKSGSIVRIGLSFWGEEKRKE